MKLCCGFCRLKPAHQVPNNGILGARAWFASITILRVLELFYTSVVLLGFLVPKFLALLQVVHTMVIPSTVSDKMHATCHCLHHILKDRAVSLEAGSDSILDLGLSPMRG